VKLGFYTSKADGDVFLPALGYQVSTYWS